MGRIRRELYIFLQIGIAYFVIINFIDFPNSSVIGAKLAILKSSASASDNYKNQAAQSVTKGTKTPVGSYNHTTPSSKTRRQLDPKHESLKEPSPEAAPLDAFDSDLVESVNQTSDLDDAPAATENNLSTTNKSSNLSNVDDIEQLVRNQVNFAAYNWMETPHKSSSQHGESGNAAMQNRPDKLSSRSSQDDISHRNHPYRNHNYGLVDSGNDILLRQQQNESFLYLTSTMDPLTTLSDGSNDYVTQEQERESGQSRGTGDHKKAAQLQNGNYPAHYVYRLRGPTQLSDPIPALYWQYQNQPKRNATPEVQQPVTSETDDSDNVVIRKPTTFGHVTNGLFTGNISPDGFVDLPLQGGDFGLKSNSMRQMAGSRWLKAGKLHIDADRQPMLLVKAKNRSTKPIDGASEDDGGRYERVPGPMSMPFAMRSTTTAEPHLPPPIASVNIEGSLADRLSANRWKNRPKPDTTTSKNPITYQPASDQSAGEPFILNLIRPNDKPMDLASSNSSSVGSNNVSPVPLRQSTQTPLVRMQATTPPSAYNDQRVRPTVQIKLPLQRVVSDLQQPATGSPTRKLPQTTATTPIALMSPSPVTVAPPLAALYAAALVNLKANSTGLDTSQTNALLRNELGHHHHLHSHIHSIKHPALISIPMSVMQPKHDSYESLVAAAAAAAAAAATASASRLVRAGGATATMRKQSRPQPILVGRTGNTPVSDLARLLQADILRQQRHRPKTTIPIGGTLASIPTAAASSKSNGWLMAGNDARASSRIATILGSANRAFKQVAVNAASLLSPSLQAANSNIAPPVHTDPNPSMRNHHLRQPQYQPSGTVRQARREYLPLLNIRSGSKYNSADGSGVPLALFSQLPQTNDLNSPEVLAVLSHILNSQSGQDSPLEDYQPEEQGQALNSVVLPDMYDASQQQPNIYDFGDSATATSSQNPIELSKQPVANGMLGGLILDDSLFPQLEESRLSGLDLSLGSSDNYYPLQINDLDSPKVPSKYNQERANGGKPLHHSVGLKLVSGETQAQHDKQSGNHSHGKEHQSPTRYSIGIQSIGDQDQVPAMHYALGHYVDDQQLDPSAQKLANSYSMPNWIIDGPPTSQQQQRDQQGTSNKYSQSFAAAATSTSNVDGFRPLLAVSEPAAGSIQALKLNINKQDKHGTNNNNNLSGNKETSAEGIIFGTTVPTTATHLNPIRTLTPVHIIHAPTPTHYIYQPSEAVQHAIYHASNLIRPYLLTSPADSPTSNYRPLLNHGSHLSKEHRDHRQQQQQHDMSTSESATRLSSVVAAPLRGQLLPNFWPIALAMIPIMIVIAIMAQLVMAAPLAMFALTTLAVSRLTGTMFGPAGIRGARSSADELAALFPLLFDQTLPAISKNRTIGWDDINKKPIGDMAVHSNSTIVSSKYKYKYADTAQRRN